MGGNVEPSEILGRREMKFDYFDIRGKVKWKGDEI